MTVVEAAHTILTEVKELLKLAEDLVDAVDPSGIALYEFRSATLSDVFSAEAYLSEKVREVEELVERYAGEDGLRR